MFCRKFARGGIRTPEDKLLGFTPTFIPLRPTGTRPCKVDDTSALFHRFIENDRGVLQVNTLCNRADIDKMLNDLYKNNFVANGCTLEKIHSTMALIEWPDGRLCTVAVERVQFTDREV